MQKVNMFAVVLYLAICSVASLTLADSPDSPNFDTGKEDEKYTVRVSEALNFIENELEK